MPGLPVGPRWVCLGYQLKQTSSALKNVAHALRSMYLTFGHWGVPAALDIYNIHAWKDSHKRFEGSQNSSCARVRITLRLNHRQASLVVSSPLGCSWSYFGLLVNFLSFRRHAPPLTSEWIRNMSPLCRKGNLWCVSREVVVLGSGQDRATITRALVVPSGQV